MPMAWRQADLATFDPNDGAAQQQDEAKKADILALKTLTVCWRKPVAAAGTNITVTGYLQHSPTGDDDSFVTYTTGTFDLTTTTTEVRTYSDLMRYVRLAIEATWTTFTTYPQYIVDIIGREG